MRYLHGHRSVQRNSLNLRFSTHIHANQIYQQVLKYPTTFMPSPSSIKNTTYIGIVYIGKK